MTDGTRAEHDKPGQIVDTVWPVQRTKWWMVALVATALVTPWSPTVDAAPRFPVSNCAGPTVTVASGDSWSVIAARAKVSMTAVLAANNATVYTTIHPGNVICLPAGATTTTGAPTTTSPATTPPTTVPATTVISLAQFPVQGNCGFVDSFGAPRSGGRLHEGVDIIANTGKYIYAVADGTLTRKYVDTPGSLTGNGWRLTAPNGTYYFYAHLHTFAAGLETGSKVKAGQILGTVGMTGNAGAPHLHFEIHPGGGAAINPTPSVRAVNGCGTSAVPPQPPGAAPPTTTASNGPTTTAPTPTANCPNGSYTVKSGDFWSRIASLNKVTLSALLAANNATIYTMIHPNQVVCLPGGATTPTTTPPTTTPPTTTPPANPPPNTVSSGALWKFIPSVVVLDTNGSRLAPNATRTVRVSGLSGIPSNVSGVMVRFSTRNGVGNGFLNVHSCAIGPGSSSLNFSAGQPNVGVSTVAVSGGNICATVNVATDVKLTVIAVQSTSGAGLQPIQPSRGIDTRESGLLQANSSRPMSLGALGVPAGTQAVTLTVTILDPASAGSLRLGPCGGGTWGIPFPAAPFQTFSAVVQASSTGICVGSTVSTHVVVDATGAWVGSGGLSPITIARQFDSRGSAPIDQSTRTVTMSGVPAGTTRAQLTVTMVTAGYTSSVFVWPCNTPRPLAAVSATPNGVITAVSVSVAVNNGQLCVSALAPVHVVFDVVATG